MVIKKKLYIYHVAARKISLPYSYLKNSSSVSYHSSFLIILSCNKYIVKIVTALVTGLELLLPILYVRTCLFTDANSCGLSPLELYLTEVMHLYI